MRADQDNLVFLRKIAKEGRLGCSEVENGGEVFFKGVH